MPIRRSSLLAAAALLAAARAQAADCGPAIAGTRAIVESDVATGNLNAPVGKRFKADLDRASGVCSAGHASEAMHLLAVAKARYGYR